MTGRFAPAPPSSWTAVARNGRRLDFVARGFTANTAASRAMFACQHSRLTADPRSCHIVADRPG